MENKDLIEDEKLLMNNNDDDEALDTEFNKFLAKYIKKGRIDKGYSLDTLAEKIGNTVTRQSLYRYENNEARIKKGIFKKICKALDIDSEVMYDEDSHKFIFIFDNGVNSLTFDNAKPLDDENVTYIPVLGTIKAGIPIEAQQEILEYIDIPKRWTIGGKEFYGLKISGDSMIPKYNENDIVIFEKTEDMLSADNKDCAVMVNGDDATFKKVSLNDNGIVLIPYNTSEYNMMIYSKEEIANKPVRIIGIAKEKRTRL